MSKAEHIKMLLICLEQIFCFWSSKLYLYINLKHLKHFHNKIRNEKKTVKFCESFENRCILRAPVATPTHTGQSALSAASGPHPRATAPPPRAGVTWPVSDQSEPSILTSQPMRGEHHPSPLSCNVPIITNHLAPVSWSRRPRLVTLDTRNKDSDHTPVHSGPASRHKNCSIQQNRKNDHCRLFSRLADGSGGRRRQHSGRGWVQCFEDQICPLLPNSLWPPEIALYWQLWTVMGH